MSNIAIVMAHGPVHEQIEKITLLINDFPDSTFLYIERGHLYGIDESYDEAIQDFKQALQLSPTSFHLKQSLAEYYLEINQPDTALVYIEEYLHQVNGDLASGYSIRGEIYDAKQMHPEAIEDFKKVIQLKNTTASQKDFLNLAHVYIQSPSHHAENAISTLEQGIQLLGNLITLESLLITITIDQKDYAKALSRIDMLLQKNQRKDRWLVKKAEVLTLSGKCQEARQYFMKGMNAISTLNPEIQQNPFTKNLIQRIKLGLKTPCVPNENGS